MADSVKALEVLRAARGLIENPRDWSPRGWGGGNRGPVSDGRRCALHALSTAARCRVVDAAHPAFRALAKAVCDDETYRYLGDFNDSHTHAEVLAAFDKAIATLEAELEPTPNADAALNIMDACHAAGEVVARQIVATHPQMDLGEITALASAELFYAAQDTARVCSVSEGLGKLAEIVERATS